MHLIAHTFKNYFLVVILLIHVNIFSLNAFDLESLQNKRSEWGLFRDRREDLYTKVIN